MATHSSDQKKVQVALVTGSSGGIGRKTACRLARDGYFILAHWNSNREGALETLASIEGEKGRGILIQFDQSKSDEVQNALETFFSDKKDHELAVCVANAGRTDDTLLGLMSDESFDRVMKTNLYGTFHVLRWSLRRMMLQRRGNIVTLSSIAGQTGNPGQGNYAASKAGIIALTKTLAYEVASRNIRVNCVAPGLIETEMTEKIPQVEKIIERIPMKRMGRPEEVAEVIAFLCSDGASYMTGQTLSVNGGLLPT